MGLDDTPDYLLPRDDSVTVSRQIADFWVERWLVRRIEKEHVLAELRRHAATYPVDHGARAPLVPEEEDEQLELEGEEWAE